MNYEIGKYTISSFCYGTYPCKHYVNYENITELMNCDDIYCMLRLNGLHHEHFDIYRDTNEDSNEMHYRELIREKRKQLGLDVYKEEYKKPKVSERMKVCLERLYGKK